VMDWCRWYNMETFEAPPLGDRSTTQDARTIDTIPELRTLYNGPPGYTPDPDHPLVYHLFGVNRVGASVVIAQDDYFQYLTRVTRYSALMPRLLTTALLESAVLLLGFQMDEWSFRVLLRSLKPTEGADWADSFVHVGVQIDPDAGRIRDPSETRKYLEAYFKTRPSIFWTPVGRFTRSLRTELQKAHP
jgi:hypothetical protein